MVTRPRRILVRSLDDITVERFDAPTPAEGELLVRSTVVGICGSDLHAASGRHPFIDLPYRPGHEVVGVVTGVGAGVPDGWVGTRVVVEPNLPCGRCGRCADGRYNICETLDVFGCQTPGGMADVFTIPVDRVHPLPDGLSDTAAALIEPLSTPVRAVRRAGDLTGRAVVVLGAGPIGLFVALAARRAGAATVVVGDPVASKRNRADRLGVTATFDPTAADAVAGVRELIPAGADVVFDCVARESSVRQAIDVAHKGSTVVVVGVAPGAVPVPLDLIQDREIDLLGSLMFIGEDMRTAIDMLADGTVPVRELVTATFPLTEAAAAFQASADPEQLKVLVTVTPEQPQGDGADGGGDVR